MYQLDQKQWQKTVERVINEIHACQEAAKSQVIRKIYRTFKPEKDRRGKVLENSSFRKELCQSLNSLQEKPALSNCFEKEQETYI